MYFCSSFNCAQIPELQDLLHSTDVTQERYPKLAPMLFPSRNPANKNALAVEELAKVSSKALITVCRLLTIYLVFEGCSTWGINTGQQWPCREVCIKSQSLGGHEDNTRYDCSCSHNHMPVFTVTISANWCDLAHVCLWAWSDIFWENKGPNWCQLGHVLYWLQEYDIVISASILQCPVVLVQQSNLPDIRHCLSTLGFTTHRWERYQQCWWPHPELEHFWLCHANRDILWICIILLKISCAFVLWQHPSSFCSYCFLPPITCAFEPQ